jgi:hypothetical protein
MPTATPRSLVLPLGLSLTAPACTPADDDDASTQAAIEEFNADL